MDNQGIDVAALQQELETLKSSYADLEGKYNQLENTHNDYKLNIEFQRDISDLYKPIGDEEKETLRSLKASGNDKAYNLLLSSLKSNSSTGGLGNFARGFNPVVDPNLNDQTQNTDAFTKAINELKGE